MVVAALAYRRCWSPSAEGSALARWDRLQPAGGSARSSSLPAATGAAT